MNVNTQGATSANRRLPADDRGGYWEFSSPVPSQAKRWRLFRSPSGNAADVCYARDACSVEAHLLEWNSKADERLGALARANAQLELRNLQLERTMRSLYAARERMIEAGRRFMLDTIINPSTGSIAEPQAQGEAPDSGTVAPPRQHACQASDDAGVGGGAQRGDATVTVHGRRFDLMTVNTADLFRNTTVLPGGARFENSVRFIECKKCAHPGADCMRQMRCAKAAMGEAF